MTDTFEQGIPVLLGFGMLGFICIILLHILRELRKQTALSREARDFVKKKHEPPVMHSQDKATYRY